MTSESIQLEFPPKKHGEFSMKVVDITNFRKRELRDYIRTNFPDHSPQTQVSCDYGIGRSRSVAVDLDKSRIVNLTNDHYLDEDGYPLETVSGTMTPINDIPVNENGQLCTKFDDNGLDLLIICAYSENDFVTRSLRKDRIEEIRNVLQRFISRTTPDYLLKVLIIRGNESQFSDTFVT